MSRACDAVACDQAQADGFSAEGSPGPPGNVAQTWIETLTSVIGADVTWIRLSQTSVIVDDCDAPEDCSIVDGLLNHVRWPDGIGFDDADLEPIMLGFLRDHPR